MLAFVFYLHLVTQIKRLQRALLVDLKVECYLSLSSRTKGLIRFFTFLYCIVFILIPYFLITVIWFFTCSVQTLIFFISKQTLIIAFLLLLPESFVLIVKLFVLIYI